MTLIHLGKHPRSLNPNGKSQWKNKEREQTNGQQRKNGCLPDLSTPTVQERLDWSLASIDGGQLGPG